MTTDAFTEAAKLARALERLERQRVISTQRLNQRYDAKRQALIQGVSKAAFRVWCAAAEEGAAADGGEDVTDDDLPPGVRPTSVQEQIALGNTSADEYETPLPECLKTEYVPKERRKAGA